MKRNFNIGTKNTITKEYGCTWKTTFILFIKYYWFYCYCWMATRKTSSGNVYHRGQVHKFNKKRPGTFSHITWVRENDARERTDFECRKFSKSSIVIQYIRLSHSFI
jgi:hypothetical protein